jgi:hypothetical protein
MKSVVLGALGRCFLWMMREDVSPSDNSFVKIEKSMANILSF